MLPTLTDEQRANALEKAMAAHRARQELKADIKARRVTVDGALAHEAAQRMRVKEFIQAFPGIGGCKAVKLMNDLGIAESRRVQGLGHRQRQGLSEALHETMGE